METESETEQEIKKQEELKALFLTATIVVVITVILAPGNFSLLSTIAGVVLLLVLFVYCVPTSKAAPINFIFSAVCALALVLALGFFLNGLYPDTECSFHPITQWECVLVPVGHYDLIQTTWGDIAALVIWGVGTFIFLKWGRKIESSIKGWMGKLGDKVSPDLDLDKK